MFCCRMEEMVANMLQYKVKIDQLKQENASMKTSYEVGYFVLVGFKNFEWMTYQQFPSPSSDPRELSLVEGIK